MFKQKANVRYGQRKRSGKNRSLRFVGKRIILMAVVAAIMAAMYATSARAAESIQYGFSWTDSQGRKQTSVISLDRDVDLVNRYRAVKREASDWRSGFSRYI